MSQDTGNAGVAAPSRNADGTKEKHQRLSVPALTITPASDESLAKVSKQHPDIDKCKGAPTIGLLSSESPDSVAAWRGRKHSRLYGKPILACHESSRVLVLPEPVYMMWPEWMQMDAVDTTASPSISEVNLGESIHLTDSELVAIQCPRKSIIPRPEGMERVSLSSFIPSQAIM